MDVTLVMFKADGTRREIPLKKPHVQIGRHNTCELRVPLPSVSRQHCELKISGGSLKLRDLGSSNGTFLNGSRVKAETPVSPGDRIQVGAVIFTAVIDGVPASLEPSESLMAAQAHAERLGGAGPAEAKAPTGDDDAPPQTESKAGSSASDELDALLSDIGDDLMGGSDVTAPAGSDDQPADDQKTQAKAKPKADAPSDSADNLAPASDEDAAADALPQLSDSDELEDASLPELSDSDELDAATDDDAGKAADKSDKSNKKKKSQSKSDDDDPISALESMSENEDDDIDLSWLEDDSK